MSLCVISMVLIPLPFLFSTDKNKGTTKFHIHLYHNKNAKTCRGVPAGNLLFRKRNANNDALLHDFT